MSEEVSRRWLARLAVGQRGSRLKPLLQGRWLEEVDAGFGVMGGYVGRGRKRFAAEAAPTGEVVRRSGGRVWGVGWLCWSGRKEVRG
jgi:hypothetical protein